MNVAGTGDAQCQHFAVSGFFVNVSVFNALVDMAARHLLMRQIAHACHLLVSG
jgi:hypothetical protein